MIFQRKGSGVSWLLVAGQPGSKYEYSYNMGLAVDGLVGGRASVSMRRRFRADGGVDGEWGKGAAAKPQTYMNLSGESVGEAARFYKIPADHVVVISDDISSPVVSSASAPQKSRRGHNGLKNIIQHLGNDQLPHQGG